jgi:FHA domain
MLRLIVNPGTDSAWEIPLQPGVISLGRGSENNVPIEHPSVANTHCQLTVTDSGVVIKDLGSINGTFVNEQMVDEAALVDGQTIRLGDVVLRFENDLIPRARPVPGGLLQPEPAAAVAVCKFHPHAPAAFRCPKCQRAFCELCVSHRQGRYFCRSCSVECARLKLVPLQAAPEQSFFRLARGAFRYPLKGDGVILLIGGGILLLLVDAAKFILRFVPGYGWVALLLVTVFGIGYLTRYLQNIVTSSAHGENDMPDWPDITDYSGEVTTPFFQLVGMAAFCFAPAAALTIYAIFGQGGAWLGWTTTAAILVGAIYFPMAFTAVAMYDSLSALNPLLIVPSIMKIPKEYALTIALFVVILTLRWLAVRVLPEVLGVNFMLPAVISDFFGLYLLAVLMRILGLLYLTKKDELNWG